MTLKSPTVKHINHQGTLPRGLRLNYTGIYYRPLQKRIDQRTDLQEIQTSVLEQIAEEQPRDFCAGLYICYYKTQDCMRGKSCYFS